MDALLAGSLRQIAHPALGPGENDVCLLKMMAVSLNTVLVVLVILNLIGMTIAAYVLLKRK